MPIIKLKFLYIPVWSMQESQKATDVYIYIYIYIGLRLGNPLCQTNLEREREIWNHVWNNANTSFCYTGYSKIMNLAFLCL